ncbi:MAG: hypothetical protein KDJ52_08910 [Anaerolineae bacterium]|nr:hypothetical protein [Anaerolineae bacterium]
MNRWALLLSALLALFEKRFSGMPRFMALFGVALGITLFLSQGAWAETLFQSPASPVTEEANPAQNQPFGPDDETEDPFAPSSQPETEDPFAPSSESEPQDPLDLSQPQDTFEEESPGNVVEDPLVEPAQEVNEPNPLDADTVSPTESAPPAEELRPVRLERDEEEGSRNFILDQAELIDTVVVSTAYVWLCCGIGLFLLIPLVFLFLQIRGRHKIIKEEIY